MEGLKKDCVDSDQTAFIAADAVHFSEYLFVSKYNSDLTLICKIKLVPILTALQVSNDDDDNKQNIKMKSSNSMLTLQIIEENEA